MAEVPYVMSYLGEQTQYGMLLAIFMVCCVGRAEGHFFFKVMYKHLHRSCGFSVLKRWKGGGREGMNNT